MYNCTINNARSTKRTTWCKWKNRTRLQKNIIIAVLVLLIVILFAALLYLLLSVKVEVCSTPACVRASKELLKYIDVKVNPCEDFYRFSCGNFLQNTKLDNRGSRSVQDIMEDEIQFEIRNMLKQPIQLEDSRAFNLAKKFYRACMNETAVEAEGLKKIKQIFKQMGGWPTLDGNNWRESQFDWKETVYKLRRMGVNFDFFFSVSIDRDKKDSSRYILGIHNVLYSPSKISDEIKRKYLDYMVDVTIIFGVSASRAREDSENVLALFLKLAKTSEESKALNKTGLYKSFNLSELQHRYPSIPWDIYINRLLDPAEFITYDDTIVVTDPLYLTRLEKILAETPKRTLANFIAWHTLQHLINFLPKEVLDKAYKYLTTVNGKFIRADRWKTCIEAIEMRMGSVISEAYIRNFFDESTNGNVTQLIRNIKLQFKYKLLATDWLDRTTKEIIIAKLISSTEEIISFDDVMEILKEHKAYNDVVIDERQLLESVLKIDFVNLNLKFGKLRKPYKNNWLRNSDFVTGMKIYYSPKENMLRLPIGILRGIYYQSDRPKYMNYGVMGSIIAHKMSHIVIEAEYGDLPGELRSWWSPNSLLNYNEKLQCLAAQYGKFQVDELGTQLNPLKTRDEDMADLAGMKVSYDTYINWVQENGAEPRLPGLNYSPNQLFWISSAIHHCSKYSTQTLERYIANYRWSPQQFRVNGPLQNLDDFAFDFGCPAGIKMNPKEKCIAW